MSDANKDEHVRFFSKFIHRRLKNEQQPQIITIDQCKQVEKEDWYVSTFLKRLIECDVIQRAGWLGHIEAFSLKEEAYKGELTLEEIRTMLTSSIGQSNATA